MNTTYILDFLTVFKDTMFTIVFIFSLQQYIKVGFNRCIDLTVILQYKQISVIGAFLRHNLLMHLIMIIYYTDIGTLICLFI